MTEGSYELTIDVPRKVKIERLEIEEPKAVPSGSTDGKKKCIVVNNKK